MKIVSYVKDGHEQLGVLIHDLVYDMEVLHPDLPATMNMFLTYWEDSFPIAQAGELLLKEGTRSSSKGTSVGQLQLLAPVPFPSSCREPESRNDP
jgi:fumarylacetoacetate (FAA) hydrolase